MKRIWILFAAAALSGVIPANAQQVGANANLGSFPAGITVMVTGSVRVTQWDEVASYRAAKGKQQAQDFAAALRATGTPAGEITVLPEQNQFYSRSGSTVQVTFSPDESERISKIARSKGVLQTQTSFIAVDAQALYDRALALAIQNGRTQALAIAAADHQHVGRLLNFIPSPLEMAKQMASATIAGLPFESESSGQVTATGIATFELIR